MFEPTITETNYYTLASADAGHGKTFWCKKKVAKLLRTTQDRIIVIDVTGEYADFVLDHDRIVPGCIPMVIHQYKLSGGWPVDAHIIDVDMPMHRQPLPCIITALLPRSVLLIRKVFTTNHSQTT